MPTFTYEERVAVCRAIDTLGVATCPRCKSAIDVSYMQSLQDKMLKRKGKPLYRCANRACACECTPISHMTAAPIRPPPAPGAPPASPPSAAKPPA